MSAAPHTISVIVPTHNRVDLLLACLRRLAAAGPCGRGDEVIVVANACTDSTVTAVQELRDGFPGELRVCEEAVANLNVARNLGASRARGAVLAFIDDDVLVTPGWRDGVRNMFDEHGADIGTGPVELCWDLVPRPEWLTPRAAKLLTTVNLGPDLFRTRSASHFVGANLSMRARLWRDLEGFRPGLDRSGGELLSGGDTEFVTRALARGARGIYHPRARLLHVVSPQRATKRYLAAVAEGRGRTRVALSRIGSSHRPLRLARYGTAQLLVGTWLRLSGLTAGDAARAMDGVVVSRRGMGTLRALTSLTGRSAGVA